METDPGAAGIELDQQGAILAPVMAGAGQV
jgi:hypothetical protein